MSVVRGSFSFDTSSLSPVNFSESSSNDNENDFHNSNINKNSSSSGSGSGSGSNSYSGRNNGKNNSKKVLKISARTLILQALRPCTTSFPTSSSSARTEYLTRGQVIHFNSILR